MAKIRLQTRYTLLCYIIQFTASWFKCHIENSNLRCRDWCKKTSARKILCKTIIWCTNWKYHLQNAKNHGVTQKEIAAVITHVAFYAGWPKAWAVFNLAKEVWETGEGDLPYEEEAMRAHAKKMVFPIGAPNDGFAQYFSGRSFLAPISTSQVGIFNVTFEPGCRNNWHIHHAKSGGGQILVCVAGRGFYQEEGRDAVEMKPGDCINIPVDVKHWHGAAPDEWFSHLAIEVPGVDCSNEWCEAVSEKEYAGLR